MNCAEKLSMLKRILGIDVSDTTQDETLEAYLSFAKNEILSWMYINYPDMPEEAELPSKYATTQVQAVVAGYNLRGGENEYKHTENGIVREWHYTDMLEYIRAHVNQIPLTR